MASRPLTTTCVTAAFCAVAVCVPTRIEAAPQQESHPSADSFSRIKRALENTPTQPLTLNLGPSVATFRATVEQRPFMLSYEEWLRTEFELTPFQRQSQEWRLKCCGMNLLVWADRLKKALRRHDPRPIREQIARELAQLEANRKK